MGNEFSRTVGGRLRVARKALGLSTRGVKERLLKKGIKASHATIGNYERALSHPPDDVLQALAEIYQRTTDWICGGGLTLKTIRYRALKSVAMRDKNEFKYQAQAWLEIYLYVESLLGRKLRSRHSNFKLNRDISGRDLAERIRKLYKIGDYPVVSTIRILEHFGIYVIQLATTARIDAFAGYLGDLRVIVLNASLPNDRIRLNALHELAHHIYEDCINGPSLTSEDIENRAFEFASHLLIPEDQLEAAFRYRSMVQLVQYKERFGISLAAMIYRAKKSNLIPQSLYRRLWQDFTRLGYRKDEPGHVASDRPLRMESLIDAAVRSNKVSFAQIAKLMGTNELIIKDRVFGAIGSSVYNSDRRGQSAILNFSNYKKKLES